MKQVQVMPRSVSAVIPWKVPKLRAEVVQRRYVPQYSWWQHKDSETPVCVVDKVTVGQGIDFRTTHVKTLKIGETNPTTIPIEKFWKLVDEGKIKDVSKPTEVTVLAVLQD